MKPRTTRTLNPLPFQDLEPRRFEDLIRQLAYDFRVWRSLEATGRGGADDGMDIRGIEAGPQPDADTADPDAPPPVDEPEERRWIFQCKRERTLAPKRIRAIVSEILPPETEVPFGFVLAVAGDVSKAARDAFREEMVARRIDFFLVWAKSELEDMLFQPKNDHLLFAYFGLSLQPRRRSVVSSLRSEISVKKQLEALIGDEGNHGKLILLRDPSDTRYPHRPDSDAQEPPAKWIPCFAMHAKWPGHLVVLVHEYLAATTPDGKQWDYLPQHDVVADRARTELWPFRHLRARTGPSEHAYSFWDEYIDQEERAHLRIYRCVPLAKVMGIDPTGDQPYPAPHVFVDFGGSNDPFVYAPHQELSRADRTLGAVDIEPDDSNRTDIFGEIVPVDVPSPKRFDDGIDDPPPLLDETGTKLQGLLAAPTDQASPSGGQSIPLDEWEKRRAERAELFRKWYSEVGLPTLSALAQGVRGLGQNARVTSRVAGRLNSRDTGEWVELRVVLKVGPGRASGQMKVKLHDNGWEVSTVPSQHDQNVHGRKPPPSPLPPARETLERQAIKFIERLKQR